MQGLSLFRPPESPWVEPYHCKGNFTRVEMKLKVIKVMAILTGLIGSTLFNRFMEGGALFMSLILACLLGCLFFCYRSFSNVKSNPDIASNMLPHIRDCGALALAIGVMGTLLGLISALDVIEEVGPVAPQIMAGGLKVALLCPLFGLFAFGISRLATLLIGITSKP